LVSSATSCYILRLAQLATRFRRAAAHGSSGPICHCQRPRSDHARNRAPRRHRCAISHRLVWESR
jgi:hypothetical protein